MVKVSAFKASKPVLKSWPNHTNNSLFQYFEIFRNTFAITRTDIQKSKVWSGFAVLFDVFFLWILIFRYKRESFLLWKLLFLLCCFCHHQSVQWFFRLFRSFQAWQKFKRRNLIVSFKQILRSEMTKNQLSNYQLCKEMTISPFSTLSRSPDQRLLERYWCRRTLYIKFWGTLE